jgi:hypothetical protein
MLPISSFLIVVESYCRATKIAEATISTRVFNDGKRIAQIRDGADIGARRLDRAIGWLSEHWPKDAHWPADVARPSVISEAAE